MKAVVHYGEIGVKGQNRYFFENQLVRNIRTALKRQGIDTEIAKEDARIVIQSKASEKKLAEVLGNVFGVQYFTFPQETERDTEKAMKKVKTILESMKKRGVKSISVETKRSDKSFPLNSIEFSKKIGEIAHKLKIKIDFSQPQEQIFAEITSKRIRFYAEKHKGLGGLPVETSGRVLCMLSGGIDSPVAAWLAMKRGCQVDFIHFHTYRKNSEALDTKIKELAKMLSRFQNRTNIYLVPYSNYQVMTQGLVHEGADLVLFKNFMMRIAERVANERHYKALVTGDSIGQVASQTLENIAATDFEISMPVIRPVVTCDKQEIINIAQKIGTLQASNKPYKDCCSIVSRKPKTKVKLDKLKMNIESAKIIEVIEKTMPQVEMFRVE